MEKPFFSVVIATFNVADKILDTLKSLEAQTFDSFELIIVDGLSTDNTIEVIKQNYPKCAYLVSEKDNGIFDAWNKALKKSKANWVLFLGAGDMLLPRALEFYFSCLNNRSFSEVDYCSSKIIALYNEKSRIIGAQFDWRIFRRYMNVAHVGSVHSMNLFKTYGMFNDSYKIAGDYEILLRPRSQLRAIYLNKITVLMPMDGLSNRDSKVLFEAYRAKVLTGGQSKILSLFHLIYSYIFMKLKNGFIDERDYTKTHLYD
jgi:glycosyltransferase involved in cell wall biosynthesis